MQRGFILPELIGNMMLGEVIYERTNLKNDPHCIESWCAGKGEKLN